MANVSELDVIDSDGASTQFSKQAIIAGARLRAAVRIAAYDGKVHILLSENGVGRNAENFAGFDVDAAASSLAIVGSSGTAFSAALDAMQNPASGHYVFDPAPSALPFEFEVLVTLACRFVNPATVNNPSATEDFELEYSEAISSAWKNQAGHTVLTLDENGLVAEKMI